MAPIFNGLQPLKMSVALYRLAGCRKTAFFNNLLVVKVIREMLVQVSGVVLDAVNKT